VRTTQIIVWESRLTASDRCRRDMANWSRYGRTGAVMTRSRPAIRGLRSRTEPTGKISQHPHADQIATTKATPL
jgi:hypothetical protein